MVEEFPIIANIVGVAAVGIGAYATSVGIAAAAQWGLNTALAANPIGAVIAAFAAAAIVLYKNWEPVIAWASEKFTWLWQTIDKSRSVGSSIGGIFNMSANASMRPVGATAGSLVMQGRCPICPAQIMGKATKSRNNIRSTSRNSQVKTAKRWLKT